MEIADKESREELSGASNIAKEQKQKSLSDIILEMVENEIEQVVSFHTASERAKDWNLKEIYQVVSTIFPIDKNLITDLAGFAENGDKLDKAKARTKIINHLVSLSREKYSELKEKITETGLNWQALEKTVLIRSIDTLWVEHLEAMSSMRQGIGLRGYGQRDPLIEYKKEAYRLYNELNNLIHKEVVYSIYKLGSINADSAPENGIAAPTLADKATKFSAPAKTAEDSRTSFSGYKSALKEGRNVNADKTKQDAVRAKIRGKDGKKIGRNDPCPCGSGKKYKKCCGA